MSTALKLTKKSSFRRRTLFLLVLLVVAGISGAAYYYYTAQNNSEDGQSASNTRPRNTVDYSPAKPEDKIGESSKDQTANGESRPTPAEQQNALTVNISNLSQDADAPNTIHVRAFTPSQVNGTCTATFTYGSSTITKTAPLVTQASYAICQGFDVPRTEFTSAGTWKIHINMTAASASGSADATIEVK